jgi:hypothetical protein
MADLTVVDDTPVAFFAHRDLPPLMAALLKDFHQAFLERGDSTTADVLARLAASDAAASLVGQMKRRSRHPTVLVDVWRRPDLRRDLRKLVRKTAFKWQDVHRELQFAADHERQHREFLMANLLVRLAELATRRPDERYVEKVMSVAWEAVDEGRASEVLRAHGLPNQAEQLKRQAHMHIWRAHTLVRTWTPDAAALIRQVRGALSWQLGFLGYGIAANLVGTALNQRITRWDARYLIKSSST